jgi:hypothetical protein
MSPKLAVCLDLFAAILLLGFEPPAQAHDIYKDLLTRSGLPCCHDGDSLLCLTVWHPKGCRCSLTISGSISRGAASNTTSSRVTVVKQGEVMVRVAGRHGVFHPLCDLTAPVRRQSLERAVPYCG